MTAWRTSARTNLPIDLFYRAANASPRVTMRDGSRRRFAYTCHFFGKAGVHGSSKSPQISWPKQEPVDTMLNERGSAASRRGDNYLAKSHCLEHRRRQSFEVGGKDEYPRPLVGSY